jgi:hypothetical protein
MHSRHGVVQDHSFNRLADEYFEASSSVERRQNPVSCPFQQNLSNPQADQFVIHAKDKGIFVRHSYLIH